MIDFRYPERDKPLGAYELAIGPEVSEYIHIRASHVAHGRRDGDIANQCWVMAPAWCDELTRQFPALTISLRGGEGGEEQDHGQGRIFADPPARRSGYVGANGNVERHYWLAIGADEAIFDPTAHQWDEKGGLSLAKYRMDGIPFTEWRAMGHPPSRGCRSTG